MSKQKILLFIAIALIVVGVSVCVIVGITSSFDCDCAKSDDDCKIVEKEELYGGTIIDMELDLAYPVTFNYSVVDALDMSSANLELAIQGRYLLVIDGKNIWFDDFNGYAMYENDIVRVDDETLRILSHAFDRNNNGGCCSCCPDLQPGESCITLCCPCGE